MNTRYTPLTICATLLLLFNSVGAGERCADSYFKIDIDIQPEDPASLLTCDADGSEKLKALLKKTIDKKFEQYLNEANNLRQKEVTELCNTSSTKNPDLQNLGGKPKNMGKFTYSGASQCRFCGLDDYDLGWIDYTENENEPGSNQVIVPKEPTIKKPATTPTSAPTFDIAAPSMFPSLQSEMWASDDELKLRRTLQRRITKKLTRKVNNQSKKSCLVGSNSVVQVTITPIGDNELPLVCPGKK